jgi:hypothetical protein
VERRYRKTRDPVLRTPTFSSRGSCRRANRSGRWLRTSATAKGGYGRSPGAKSKRTLNFALSEQPELIRSCTNYVSKRSPGNGMTRNSQWLLLISLAASVRFLTPSSL